MAKANPDECEFHVSILNGLTAKPYIDSTTGLTSLDMPYSSCELELQMYETKGNNVSTCKIAFPPLQESNLRGILVQINETDRVEIYVRQPDVGTPYWAGFIPPGGITQAGGVVTLDVQDSLTRGNWQTLRKIEEASYTPLVWYQRAMSWYTELVNEDWASATPTQYATTYNNLQATQIQGNSAVWTSANASQFFGVSDQMCATGTGAGNNNYGNPPLAPWVAGGLYYMEIDISIGYDPTDVHSQCGITIGATASHATNCLDYTVQFGMNNAGDGTLPAGTLEQVVNATLWGVASNNVGGLPVYNANQQKSVIQAADVSILDNPISGHLEILLTINQAGTAASLYVLFNGQPLISTGMQTALDPTVFLTNGFNFTIIGGSGEPQNWGIGTAAGTSSPKDILTVDNVRVRTLTPYINPAPNFASVTTDPIYYLPQRETLLSFLNFVTDSDGAEYRILPQKWPTLDLLEIGQQGTLGKNLRTLGWSQAGGSNPGGQAAETAPYTAVTDGGIFLQEPPFRFEEGWNLQDIPAVNPKNQSFGNDVTRLGSNTQDAQQSGEQFNVADTGNPRLGLAAKHPVVEVISNDDRANLPTTCAAMATYELARRVDPTPSITVKYNEDYEYAFLWREGDTVRVKTYNLLSNIDQDMRIVSVKMAAGSPVREVTLGYQEFDPTSLRMLRENAAQAWNFDQSGSNSLVMPYPTAQNGTSLTAGATTSYVYPIPIDAFSSGTTVVGATIHWFTDGSGGVDVMSVVPVIDGNQISMLGRTEKSNTDSGTQDISGILSRIGKHTLAFKNTGAGTTVLLSAFITLKIKP